MNMVLCEYLRKKVIVVCAQNGVVTKWSVSIERTPTRTLVYLTGEVNGRIIELDVFWLSTLLGQPNEKRRIERKLFPKEKQEVLSASIIGAQANAVA